MNNAELLNKLEALILNWEDECVEFKEASRNFPTEKIGEYFSALSNEANLQEKESSWLIFGVNNKSRCIVSTEFRKNKEHLLSLQKQMHDLTGYTFRHIHEVNHSDGRVIMFEIPPAPPGMPVSSAGHFYARAGESLIPLSADKYDRIRQQGAIAEDWSAAIVPEATIDDLDPRAIEEAKKGFVLKHANSLSEEDVDSWSTKMFLDKARITRAGKITKTALLLLGKPESSTLLNPHPAEIVWKLRAEEEGNEIFHPPFLLTTSLLYQKIRNIQIRILPKDSLVAAEISKYDKRIILEALHNCIAHQDYRASSRIIVTEYKDSLTLENSGSFFLGEPNDYIEGERTPYCYRNQMLASAMSELNMIDSMGYGIHSIYHAQAKRFFPMPDYECSPNRVLIRLYGHAVDSTYTQLLMSDDTLSLMEIWALDRIQKGIGLDSEMLRLLRKKKLIEGKSPHVRLSTRLITRATDDKLKQEIMSQTEMSDETYKAHVIDILKDGQGRKRAELIELLQQHLPGNRTSAQIARKMSTILRMLREDGRVICVGDKKAAVWYLKALDK